MSEVTCSYNERLDYCECEFCRSARFAADELAEVYTFEELAKRWVWPLRMKTWRRDEPGKEPWLVSLNAGGMKRGTTCSATGLTFCEALGAATSALEKELYEGK